MIWRPCAASTACALTLAAACSGQPAAAPLFGSTSAEECAVAVGGNVRNSSVNIVCGIPREQVAEFIRLAVSGRPGDDKELRRRLDALIPKSSQLQGAALARFFAVLNEAETPPEHLTEKLVQIAVRHQGLLTDLQNTRSSDPEIQELKAQAYQAIQEGDFIIAENYLSQAKKRDLHAIDTMQVDVDARRFSAAESDAENGDLMMTQFRYEEAVNYYTDALQILPESMVTHTIVYLAQLGNVLLLSRIYWEASKQLEKALNLSMKLPQMMRRFSLGDDNTAQIQLKLCESYRRSANLDRAAMMCMEALKHFNKRLQPSGDTAMAARQLALVHKESSRYADAEQLLQHAIAISETTYGPEDPSLATDLSELADLYGAIGRHADAEPLLKRVIAIDEKAFGPEYPGLASSLSRLADLYWAIGRPADAEPLLRRTIAILEEVFPPDDPYLAEHRENHDTLTHAINRADEASKFRAETEAARP